MTDEEAGRLRRENDYLKARCAQLQGDVTDLSSEALRLRQELERITSRRAAAASALPGGQ
jgi:prefoldin subunit 5